MALKNGDSDTSELQQWIVGCSLAYGCYTEQWGMSPILKKNKSVLLKNGSKEYSQGWACIPVSYEKM